MSTADLQIEAVGGGAYDLVLAETTNGTDFVLVGDTNATHPAAVLQRLAYAFGVWLEESRFDRTVGFPWEQAVFGIQPLEGIPVLVQERAQTVEGVEGVASAPELLYDTETRRLVFDTLRVQGADFEVEYTTEIFG